MAETYTSQHTGAIIDEQITYVLNNKNKILTTDSGIHNDINSALQEAKDYTESEIAAFDFIKIVDELPEEGLPNKLYLVSKIDTQTQDLFDEYVWINKGTEENPDWDWEWLTTKQVEIDLSDYVKNTDLATYNTAGLLQVANKTDILSKESSAKAITPAYLDYAAEVTTNQSLSDSLTDSQLKMPLSTQAIKDKLKSDLSTASNTLTETASGRGIVQIKDVSPIPHPVNVKLKAVNVLNESKLVGNGLVQNEDGSFTFTAAAYGDDTSRRSANVYLFGDYMIPPYQYFTISFGSIEGTGTVGEPIIDVNVRLMASDGGAVGHTIKCKPSSLSNSDRFDSRAADVANTFIRFEIPTSCLNPDGTPAEITFTKPMITLWNEDISYAPYVDTSNVSLSVGNSNILSPDVLDISNWTDETGEGNTYYYNLDLLNGEYIITVNYDWTTTRNMSGIITYVQSSTDDFVNVQSTFMAGTTNVYGYKKITVTDSQKYRLKCVFENDDLKDYFEYCLWKVSLSTDTTQYEIPVKTAYTSTNGTYSVESISPIMTFEPSVLGVYMDIEYNQDLISFKENIESDIQTNSNDILSLQNDIQTVTEEASKRTKQLQYYGDADIEPSDESLFTFTLNASKSAYSVSLKIPSEYDLTTAKIIIPYEYDGLWVTKISDSGFAHAKTYFKMLDRIIIPGSISEIGYNAFYNNPNITYAIEIPDSVRKIGGFAFCKCFVSRELKIPDSITTIEAHAFENTSIVSLILPKSLTDISDGAFALCNILRNVYYEGSPSQWEQITIGASNDYLLNANIHYSYVEDGYYATSEEVKKISEEVKTNSAAAIKSMISDEIALRQDDIIAAVVASLSSSGNAPVYVSTDEPTEAANGSIWVDTDEN